MHNELLHDLVNEWHQGTVDAINQIAHGIRMHSIQHVLSPVHEIQEALFGLAGAYVIPKIFQLAAKFGGLSQRRGILVRSRVEHFDVQKGRPAVQVDMAARGRANRIRFRIQLVHEARRYDCFLVYVAIRAVVLAVVHAEPRRGEKSEG